MRKTVYSFISMLAIVLNGTMTTCAESSDVSTAVGIVEKVENNLLTITFSAAKPVVRPMVVVQPSASPLIYDPQNVRTPVFRPHKFVRDDFSLKKMVLKMTGTSRFTLLAPAEVSEKTIVTQRPTDIVAGQSITVTYSLVNKEHVLLTAVIQSVIQNMHAGIKAEKQDQQGVKTTEHDPE